MITAKKRIISIILSFVMLFGMLPVGSVFAVADTGEYDENFALNMAIDIFRASVNKEITADINNDGIIDVGDLAIVDYYYGKNSGSADWNEAKIVDMNKDNTIDITDLAFVASKIEE